MQGFVAELQASRASLVQLRGAVLQSPPKLRGALGPGIWLWSGNRSVNLNTAELEELLQLPGVARAVAERALDSRRREGTFHDLADFGARAGIGAEGVAHLTTMAEAMQREGTYSRR
ncbi:MAG: ComEA family DNA-binding protein [Steroidobacteraceae bacterium]